MMNNSRIEQLKLELQLEEAKERERMEREEREQRRMEREEREERERMEREERRMERMEREERRERMERERIEREQRRIEREERREHEEQEREERRIEREQRREERERIEREREQRREQRRMEREHEQFVATLAPNEIFSRIDKIDGDKSSYKILQKVTPKYGDSFAGKLRSSVIMIDVDCVSAVPYILDMLDYANIETPYHYSKSGGLHIYFNVSEMRKYFGKKEGTTYTAFIGNFKSMSDDKHIGIDYKIGGCSNLYFKNEWSVEWINGDVEPADLPWWLLPVNGTFEFTDESGSNDLTMMQLNAYIDKSNSEYWYDLLDLLNHSLWKDEPLSKEYVSINDVAYFKGHKFFNNVPRRNAKKSEITDEELFAKLETIVKGDEIRYIGSDIYRYKNDDWELFPTSKTLKIDYASYIADEYFSDDYSINRKLINRIKLWLLENRLFDPIPKSHMLQFGNVEFDVLKNKYFEYDDRFPKTFKKYRIMDKVTGFSNTELNWSIEYPNEYDEKMLNLFNELSTLDYKSIARWQAHYFLGIIPKQNILIFTGEGNVGKSSALELFLGSLPRSLYDLSRLGTRFSGTSHIHGFAYQTEIDDEVIEHTGKIKASSELRPEEHKGVDQTVISKPFMFIGASNTKKFRIAKPNDDVLPTLNRLLLVDMAFNGHTEDETKAFREWAHTPHAKLIWLNIIVTQILWLRAFKDKKSFLPDNYLHSRDADLQERSQTLTEKIARAIIDSKCWDGLDNKTLKFVCNQIIVDNYLQKYKIKPASVWKILKEAKHADGRRIYNTQTNKLHVTSTEYNILPVSATDIIEYVNDKLA